MLDLSEPTYAHTLDRLRDDTMIWLCSVRPDGRPHVVPVWFLLDGNSILTFSQPENQKVRNLRQNPNVMLALDDTHGGGDVVMIEGRAELVDDPSVTAAMYQTKYARQLAQLATDPRELYPTRQMSEQEVQETVRLFADHQGMARAYSQAIRITPMRIIQS